MFEYHATHTQGLRAYFADAHRNGDVIEFGGCRFSTVATLADGTNAIRAILVIADSMTADEFECMFEDINATVSDIEQLFDIIADEYDIATNSTEFVENADGSVHLASVIPATVATATDTETVTTTDRHGNRKTARQTVADAHAVIKNGHAKLVELAEREEIETDFADLHEFETLTESE